MAAPIEPNEWLLGPDYLDWRDRQTVFSGFTSTRGIGDCDLTEGAPVRLRCGQVESTFLSTLGMTPLLGEDLSRDDDRPGAPPVALLSHSLWLNRFGGRRELVGLTVEIDSRLVRVD